MNSQSKGKSCFPLWWALANEFNLAVVVLRGWLKLPVELPAGAGWSQGLEAQQLCTFMLGAFQIVQNVPWQEYLQRAFCIFMWYKSSVHYKRKQFTGSRLNLIMCQPRKMFPPVPDPVWKLRNTLRKSLWICLDCSFGLRDELIGFWWPEVKGHGDSDLLLSFNQNSESNQRSLYYWLYRFVLLMEIGMKHQYFWIWSFCAASSISLLTSTMSS